MIKAYKYRLLPTEDQSRKLTKWFGMCRFVYNLGLEVKITAWTSAQKSISPYELMRQMTELKKTECPWLDAPKNSLDAALNNLGRAYDSFFKGGGFPKIKKRSGRQSMLFRQNIIVDSDSIRLPRLGFISFIRHRPIGDGIIKQAIKGKKTDEQSKSWHKQKMVVAKLYQKIKNQRQDFLHKTSTSIIKNHDTICLEDLNVKGMMQNAKLSRSISDVGWSEFNRMLQYKADWYGKNIRIIGRFDPSSKICSDCGNINQELKLSDREWTCQECGSRHDRDHNAAKNIKSFGLNAKPSPVNVAQKSKRMGRETKAALAPQN